MTANQPTFEQRSAIVQLLFCFAVFDAARFISFYFQLKYILSLRLQLKCTLNRSDRQPWRAPIQSLPDNRKIAPL